MLNMTGWSAPTVLEVRLIFLDSFPFRISTYGRRIIGAVRKAMGVPFLGETREEDRMYIADVLIPGLDHEACRPYSRFSGFFIMIFVTVPASMGRYAEGVVSGW